MNSLLRLLKDYGFPEDQWNVLGLKLGIRQLKLSSIASNNRKDVKACLSECLSCWLQQNFDTNEHGRPMIDLLAAALRMMGQNAVASGILLICKQVTF